jgi:hypothetical protein
VGRWYSKSLEHSDRLCRQTTFTCIEVALRGVLDKQIEWRMREAIDRVVESQAAHMLSDQLFWQEDYPV